MHIKSAPAIILQAALLIWTLPAMAQNSAPTAQEMIDALKAKLAAAATPAIPATPAAPARKPKMRNLSVEETSGDSDSSASSAPATPAAPVAIAAPAAPAAPPAHVAATAPAAAVAAPSMATPAAAAKPATLDLAIQFDLNSDHVQPASMKILASLAEALQAPDLAQMRFRVEGHTDGTGSPARNRRLSALRAEQVKRVLVSNHVAASRLVTEGKGSSELLNAADPGAAENRRVRIVTLEH